MSQSQHIANELETRFSDPKTNGVLFAVFLLPFYQNVLLDVIKVFCVTSLVFLEIQGISFAFN